MLPFQIAFREGFLWSLLLYLFLSLDEIKKNRASQFWLAGGALTGFISGIPAGFFPQFSHLLPDNVTWTFWRFVSESVIFYLSVVFLAMRTRSLRPSAFPGLGLLGFLFVFFEARAASFVIHDIGLMQGNLATAAVWAALGLLCGFIPFIILTRYYGKLPVSDGLTFPIAFMLAGTLEFVFNGVGELEKGSILSALQNGISGFLSGAEKQIQSALLLADHPFLKVPLSGLFDYFTGDRMVMSLALIFLMGPPVLILLVLFARPDPAVNDLTVAAQRRLKVAFFRKDIMLKTIPVLISFFMIIVMIQASSISLNPLYDPVPIPIRESGGSQKLVIPFADRLGDLSDGKMRKYVYYYGNKEVIFLAVLKPDGSVGVALDQCEICRPAAWNKAAQGYAQRGNTLVCKYCMTPIALPTINNPGGCNPIPLPFTTGDHQIILSLKELLNTWKKAEALDKKGTHL